ncbi:MAG: hypothetical protein RLZZ488_2410 [Pseudomonadota bacterium]|jgi:hypothetical protein
MKTANILCISAALFLVIAACGAESTTRTGTGADTGTNPGTGGTNTGTGGTNTGTTTDGAQYTATYKAVILTNCASSGCHEGSVSPNLSTFAGVKAKRDRMLIRINAGTMPKGTPKANWNSTDKANLVDYLTNSTDFN